MSKRSESKPKIAAEAIENNLVFSKRAVWAHFTLPSAPYEYQKSEDRIREAAKLNQICSALMRNNDSKPLELAIWVTPKPYDTIGWVEQWDDRVTTWGEPAPGYSEYVMGMAERVDTLAFSAPQTSIAILLGRRGTGATGENSFDNIKLTMTAAWESLKSVADKTLLLADPEPTIDERAYYAKQASDHLDGMRSAEPLIKPSDPEDIAYLIKAPFYPSMEVPDVTSSPHESWGQGEVYSLASSRIHNGAKHLKVEQEDYTGKKIEGYKSTLAFTRFPTTLFFPQQPPWVYAMHATGVDASFYGRFTLSPRSKVQKDISKKIKSTEDEMQNASSAGGTPPRALQEQYNNAKELEHRTSRGDDPWVYGRWRIVVSAATQEALEKDVKNIITTYASQQIDLIRPTGDQLNLLFESLPGDHVRLTSYMQYHALDIIGGGMPTASSAVGDRLNEKGKGWYGPYLGYTTSGMISPVNLSPHLPIAHDNPGGLLITGAPGGGKSFAAFTMTCQMAMQGIWCVYIDPKSDAVPMSNLKGIGNVNVFDLAKEGADGMLDPFSLGGTLDEQVMMASEIVSLLLGGMEGPEKTALMSTLNLMRDEAKDGEGTATEVESRPSMKKLLDRLRASENEASQSLGGTLLFVSRLPYANLCFGEGGTASISPRDSLTIITLLGLDIPPIDMNRVDYGSNHRLAVTVLYLVSHFTLSLMQSVNKHHPKAIIIDEAWAITSTPQGASMIPKIARLGRSLNTALVLVSQNAGDFQGSEGSGTSYANSMSVRMAFRASNQEEAKNVVKLLDLNDSPSIIEDIMNLENGECIIRDNKGRTARVQVDAWNQEWTDAFETNPDKAAANAKRLEEAA